MASFAQSEREALVEEFLKFIKEGPFAEGPRKQIAEEISQKYGRKG